VTAKLDRLGIESDKSGYWSTASFNTEMGESLYPFALSEQRQSQNMGRCNRALASPAVDPNLDQKTNLCSEIFPDNNFLKP